MTTNHDEQLTRARGALWGQAVGDALGTTVEFASAAAVREAFPRGVHEVLGGGPFKVLPGQVTDDTEMALALARTLARLGRWDADAVAAAYVDWAESDPFDMGGTTATALAWRPARGPGLAARVMARASRSSEANGALMRVSPLGVLGARLDEPTLLAAVSEDARLTHPHPFCVAASQVFAWTVARAVVTGAPGRELYAAAVELAGRLEGDGAARVREVLGEAAGPVPDDLSGATQGWVRHALRAAFSLLRQEVPVGEALPELTLRGGDTDTTCAIAGALLGAAQGERAIPGAWVKAVRGCRSPRPDTYQASDIGGLAEALLGQ